MFEDDAIKKLEARLERLEAAQSGAASAGPYVRAIVDPGPSPWGGGWGGWGGVWGGGRPGPIVDPAVYASLYRSPVDIPWWYGGRPPWGPIPDPAAFAGAAPQQAAAASLGRYGPIMDPPPIDISRFSIVQLEAALHSINAEKARLTSMESLVKSQLEKVKEQG